MKNPFTKPKCEHGIPAGGHCSPCGYLSKGANWLYSSYGDWHFHWVIGGIFGAIAIIGSVLAIGIGATIYVFTSRECARYEQVAAVETDYSFLGGGCIVKTEDGNWVALAAYKQQYNVKVR